jgi:uncharacterized protein YjbI with pentapeptide repeats
MVEYIRMVKLNMIDGSTKIVPSLVGLDFKDVNLAGANLTNFDINNSDFTNATLLNTVILPKQLVGNGTYKAKFKDRYLASVTNEYFGVFKFTSSITIYPNELNLGLNHNLSNDEKEFIKKALIHGLVLSEYN